MFRKSAITKSYMVLAKEPISRRYAAYRLFGACRGFHNLKYHERLSQMGLTTLKNRRLRGDLIETYKLLTNNEDIDSKQFFQLTEDPSYELRGNNRGIHKTTEPKQKRNKKEFLQPRVVDYTGTTYHRTSSMQTLSTVSNQDLTSSGRKQQIWDNKPSAVPSLLSHQHQVQV